MLTQKIADHSITHEKQHNHQCAWCGHIYGEFTDRDCLNGHTFDRCCLECEKSAPDRKDLYNK